jgi:hypothetical protein
MVVHYGWRVLNAQAIVKCALKHVLPKLFPKHVENLLFWTSGNAFFVESVLGPVHLKLFSEQVIIEWQPGNVKTFYWFHRVKRKFV